MVVASGAHPHYKRDPSWTIKHAVADLILTRGEGVTDADFARQIDEGTGTQGVPEPFLMEKWRNLAATEVPLVRAAACRQLTRDRQPCVDR